MIIRVWNFSNSIGKNKGKGVVEIIIEDRDNDGYYKIGVWNAWMVTWVKMLLLVL